MAGQKLKKKNWELVERRRSQLIGPLLFLALLKGQATTDWQQQQREIFRRRMEWDRQAIPRTILDSDVMGRGRNSENEGKFNSEIQNIRGWRIFFNFSKILLALVNLCQQLF
jgi:hypothetical protein